MSGRVEALWTKRAHNGPMDPTDELILIEGKGIGSDANFGRSKRQVSVIEKEVFESVMKDLPEAVSYTHLTLPTICSV